MEQKKQIEEMVATMCDFHKDESFCGENCDHNCRYYEQAEHLYNAGYRKERQGEWVSVEDRLPEDGMTVLTIDTEGKNEVCFYQKEWEGVFQQCGGLIKIFNITHWQPLPKPPKMKGVE